MLPHLARAGQWLLHSGIQESNGGVARYYRSDLQRNHPVSAEITGYAASALIYLHTLERKPEFLDAALRAAHFLTRTAWDAASQTMPFETEPAAFTYFFDCGIIVRALLAVWRATGDDECLDVAAALGTSMARDFPSPEGDLHPILSLPDKRPSPRDELSWSASAGCYQLKAAMAWWDLAEATGDASFQKPYERTLEYSLRTYGKFLPGHPDRLKVMDRLHAFLYFLEGMLPRASDRRCAAAICDGIGQASRHLRQIAPQFARSDVYAQLLRIRLYADWMGAAPLDREAAQEEADILAGFQAADKDPRIDGGFYFGRKAGAPLPFVNPVSTAFALQALALWDLCRKGGAQPHRHLLI